MLPQRTYLLLVLLAATITAPAQTFTTLLSFDGSDGAGPVFGSLIQGPGGNLYGTTEYGGDLSCNAPSGCGTVFRMTPRGRLTTLHRFDVADGTDPEGGVILATDKNFYGTTGAGGDLSCDPPYGCGTVFRMTPDGTFTTLHIFESTDGLRPLGGVIQAADGSLYGTTFGSDPYSLGTIFKISLEGTFTTIYRFCASPPDCPDGRSPLGALVQAVDGNFYGTASAGGRFVPRCPIGCGTIFKLTPAGKFTTLYRFHYFEGESPSGTLVQGTDGSLYGTAMVGGAYGVGTVFKIDPTGVFNTLHTFSWTDGVSPVAPLVQATDGNLYGTTKEGGGGTYDGTIFQITPGGSFTTLHHFCHGLCLDGGFVWTGLLQDTNGVFYGTTAAGGTSSDGTIYSLDAGLGPFISMVRNAGKVGTAQAILGQGFTGAIDVSFNGTPATFAIKLDTLLIATVPPGATPGYVTVTTPNGTLTSNKPFMVLP